MITERRGFHPAFCPYFSCSSVALSSFLYDSQFKSNHSKSVFLVRYGYCKTRSSDGKRVRRYRCNQCKKTFNSSRFTEVYNQKRRDVNFSVFKLLTSGVSRNQTARILLIDRKTVTRKLIFLGNRAKRNNIEINKQIEIGSLNQIEFDEAESSIHSKLKPVSIPMIVDSKTCRILGIGVAEMPARGKTAELSVRKYGKRKDEREKKAVNLINSVIPLCANEVIIKSDENPKYGRWIKKAFTGNEKKYKHETIKGKRGAVTGQGELKKMKFDPLFNLNHTFAMIRTHVPCLKRKTWDTSKKQENLEHHLQLYMYYHNAIVLKERAEGRTR